MSINNKARTKVKNRKNIVARKEKYMNEQWKKSKMKNLIKEKGITLIALVVTIIVLLILAGVSISMLTGCKCQ